LVLYEKQPGIRVKLAVCFVLAQGGWLRELVGFEGEATALLLLLGVYKSQV